MKRGTFATMGTASACALLVLVLAGVLGPFAPVFPASGLDPSWQLGLNQALVQHLRFGKQVIFTFGPYAFLYTHLYTPQTA